MLLPVFDKRSLKNITSKESQVHSIGNNWIDGDWFYDIPAKGYGSIPKVEINYTRFWSDMRNHVKWTLSYQSGNAWVDVSNQMTIRTVNRNGGKEKFAVDFTPQQSGLHRLQLMIDWKVENYDNEPGHYAIDDNGTQYWIPPNYECKLLYRTGKYNWGFKFNYNDISNVAGLGFGHYVNNQGQFVFNITRNIPIGGVGRKISLDPSYGVITQSVVSSYEWNAAEANSPSAKKQFVRLNQSEYYLIAYRGKSGTENDGYVSTIRVWSNNGTIQQSVVDTKEFLNTVTLSTVDVIHIPNTDIYGVIYSRSANQIYMKTFKVWDTNGTIQKTNISSATFSTAVMGIYIYPLMISNNILAIVFQASSAGLDGFIHTIWISSQGVINTTWMDTQEIESVLDLEFPSMVLVDYNTVAVVYDAGAAGDYDGFISTWNISATTGLIDATASDTWEWNPNLAYTPDIIKIKDNVFAIESCGGADGCWINTTTISNTGTITKSWIDTCRYSTTLNQGLTGLIFSIHDASSTANGSGLYGITYANNNNAHAWVCTLDIDSNGYMSLSTGNISSYKFDTFTYYYSSICYVNQSWYLIIYSDSGLDGRAATILIQTNWAIPASIPEPANGSGTELQPWCNVTISDKNGDNMNVSWYENSTGPWIYKSHNNSVGNGTYRWKYTEATETNHIYYWRVCINDSMHNVTYTYHFSTAYVNYPPTIELSYPKPNGTTNVPLNPICGVWVNDSNLNASRVIWQENSTGTWITRQINATVPSGTNVTWNSSGLFAGSYKTYYFRVYANDSIANTSKTFHFRTMDLYPPTADNPYPANHSILIPVTPQMDITVNDDDGAPMDVYWLSNSSTLDSLILRPEANGANNQLLNTSAITDYECVNEETANDDTDLVYASKQTSYKNDTFIMQDSAETKEIVNINVYARMKEAHSGFPFFPPTTPKGKIVLLINGHYYDGSENTLTTSYVNYNYSWSTNPDTDLAWTWNDINNAQVGVALKGYVASLTTSRCTQLYLVATFINHSNWAIFGTNNSVYNGTYYQTNSNFSDLDTTYYWQLHVFDGLHWNNYSYDFTTGINNCPTVDTEEPTNNSINVQLTPQCNITINDLDGDAMDIYWYNSSDGIIWNLAQENTTVYNGTYSWTYDAATDYNTEYWWAILIYDGFQECFQNYRYSFTTIAQEKNWNTINDWNGSLYFSGTYNLESEWNGSLYVSPSFNLESEWNGSLYVSPSFNIESEYNGSLYVQPSFNLESEWNGSIYVVPSWVQDSEWNGSLYVQPSFNLESEYNGSLYFQGEYNLENEINGSLYVSTVWNTINEWNGSLYVYGYKHNITLSDPYPANNSINAPINVTVHITVVHLHGLLMNLTWYWGNSSVNCTHVFGHSYNVLNGTYYMHYHNASVLNTTYWWRVNASDVFGNYANESYWFNTTRVISMNLFMINKRVSLPMVICFVFIGSIFLLLFKRRKKKPEYDET